MLGNLAGALPGQPHVVAVNGLQPRRQGLVVRVTHQVQAHIHAVAHAVQDLAE